MDSSGETTPLTFFILFRISSAILTSSSISFPYTLTSTGFPIPMNILDMSLIFTFAPLYFGVFSINLLIMAFDLSLLFAGSSNTKDITPLFDPISVPIIMVAVVEYIPAIESTDLTPGSSAAIRASLSM